MDSIDIQILNREVRLSYSSLKHFLSSPEHFIHYKNQPKVDTDATIFGSAFHCYVLSNSEFEKKYHVFDDKKRPSPDQSFAAKVNKEWRNEIILMAQELEKIVISQEEYDVIRVMNDKLHFVEPSRELLEFTRAEYEKSLTYERSKLKFLSIVDIRSHEFLADLKTCSDADPVSFQRDIFKFGYDLQTACYQDADANGHAFYNKLKPFYFIAIEKSEPHGVSVHRMSEEAANFAFEEYLTALDNFNKCLDDPSLFLRTYDYYCSDQVNKVFDINTPYWKKVI